FLINYSSLILSTCVGKTDGMEGFDKNDDFDKNDVTHPIAINLSNCNTFQRKYQATFLWL
ncbi:MAG: hypothetical protein IJS54_06310, partial [Desulfovibrio sp.]|nr:hypothetical protein [Desulfovibrio sp.]